MDNSQNNRSPAHLEESLQHSQLLLSTFQKLAHLGSWQFDLATNCLTWSDEVSRIFGLEAQTVNASYEAFLETIHPEDRSRVDATYRVSVETKQEGFESVYRIIQAGSGETRYVHGKCFHEQDRLGKIIRSTGIIQDITERKMGDEALQRQARIQRMLVDISLKYINLHPEDIETAINQSLAELGTLIEADRVYIFAYDFQAQICRNTHEWCAVGIEPQINALQAMPLDDVPDWITAHTSGQDMHIPDVAALPPGYLKDILAPQHIKSLLAVPMMDGTTCIGFIGFDSLRNLRAYTEDEKRLLRMFAGLLVNVAQRRQADEKLRSTQANMVAIIENTLDSIWAINTRYEILYTNEVFAGAFNAVFGVVLEPGKNLLESIPAPIQPVWKERYDRAFNGERFVFVDAIETGSTVICIEVAVNPIVFDGKIVGASFFGRDVTERKRVENERDIALVKYQTLFENFPLGISVTNQAGEILETNSAAEKLLAVPQEEHLQRSIDSPAWQIIGEDGKPFPSEKYASVLALKENRLVENVRMGIVKPGGAVTWINVSAAPLPVPGYGVVITYGDISAQLQAGKALRENNQFVTSLLRAIPVAVFVKDKEGRYLDCNASFTEITGIAPEMMRGKTAFDLWPGDLAHNYHQKDLELLRTRQHQTYEFQVQDKSNQLRQVIFAKDIFLDSSGEVAGIVGAFLDITDRKRMEDILRTKEWAIASSINAIILADLSGSLNFVNPAFLSMWGYDDEADVLGKGSNELWQNPDEATRVLEIAQQQGRWCGELLGKRKDGSSFTAEVTYSMVTNENGQPLALLGVFTDISERKRTEHALRASEERYRSLFNRIPDGIYRSTHDGQFVELNPSMVNMFGYSSMEEMMAVDIANEMYFNPEDRDSHILDTGEYGIETYRMRRKDGSEIWVEDQGYYLADDGGNILFHEGILRDVTERLQAEAALRKSETLYRQAIVAAGAVPYLQSYTRANGHRMKIQFDFIGEGIKELTGYAADEFNEIIWDDIVQESFLVDELAVYEWHEAIHRVRAGKLPVWKCEHHIRTRDGSTRWVFEAAVELRDQDGLSYGSIGMYQDITSRKQAEERILQLNSNLEQRVKERTARLEEAIRELESFSYSVSHDLRAPLRAIDGYSRIIDSDYGELLPEDGRALLNQVRASAQRMGILIDDLLKFSRLIRQPLVKQTIEMSSLVESALATFGAEIETYQPQIPRHPLPACQGDPSLLVQVWHNLLSNALKFTRKCENASIEIGCLTTAEQVQAYYIRDNGVGFDMRYVHKLFGVFERLHTESEFEGTGVGLALVQRIITRHGGRIWADSTPGSGATFYFTLDER